MATTEEAAVFVSRIEKYFQANFPDEVRREYLRDFKTFPADVLAQAIASICESTSHTRPPPTRKDVNEAVQRIYDARAQKRKKNTPTLSTIPFQKRPKPEQDMAKDALDMIERLTNRTLKTDDLEAEMRRMAEKHKAVNGDEWRQQADYFKK